jgi:hypothetical protein
MSEHMSAATLEEIERRCGMATPGPWKSFVEGRDHISGSDFIRTGADDIYLTGATIADQDFIANVRQDLPALLQEIRALRHELEQR